MTLIPCVSEKLFRPWDDRAGSRKAEVKEEPRLLASPSSSSSSSVEESGLDSSMGVTSFSPIQQAYSAQLMLHSRMHPHFPSVGWMHPHHPNPIQPSAPTMDQFLASIDPESIHPHQLAALGMGPADIGELYQLAGLKPMHHPLASGSSASTHPSKKQRPKRFRCPHCQVAFSNNGQLKGHVRSHTGNLHKYPSHLHNSVLISMCLFVCLFF